MICISPIAPFRDLARTWPALSTRITDRIQRSGTANRVDASVTKAANGSAGRVFARCVADNARSACAAMLNSIDDAKIATMYAIAPSDRQGAFVLAAAKG